MGVSDDSGWYSPRSVRTGKVETDLDKIEEMLKIDERDALLAAIENEMTSDEPDPNIKQLIENIKQLIDEALLVIKLLHSEELGKNLSNHRAKLLEDRELELESQRQIKLKIKLDRVKAENRNSTLWHKSIGLAVKKALGLGDDDDKPKGGGEGIAPF